MKQLLLFILFSASFTNILSAQERQHKIIFDFTKSDTASFATIVRHAKNKMTAADNAKVEVVCHGPGLDILMKDKTTVQKEIEELQVKYNVVFAACAGTMKRRGVDKDQLVQRALIVPYANLEFSSKQQEGWSYIKSGN